MILQATARQSAGKVNQTVREMKYGGCGEERRRLAAMGTVTARCGGAWRGRGGVGRGQERWTGRSGHCSGKVGKIWKSYYCIWPIYETFSDDARHVGRELIEFMRV